MYFASELRLITNAWFTLVTLLKAILHNLNASRKLWSNISDKILPSVSTVEIQQETGFCNKWHKGSRQVFLRACSLPKCLFTLLCCDLFILLLCCTVVLQYIGFVGIFTQLRLIKKLILTNTDIS